MMERGGNAQPICQRGKLMPSKARLLGYMLTVEVQREPA